MSPLVSATGLAQAPSWPQWRGRPAMAWPRSTSLPRLASRADAQVGRRGGRRAIPRRSSPRDARRGAHARGRARGDAGAYDLVTGKRLWQDAYDAPYQMNPAAQQHGPGPKSTPAIAGGRVFTLGISGVLSALDLATGKVLWRTPAATTAAALRHGDVPARRRRSGHCVHGRSRSQGAFTAFDAATGAVRWRWTGDGPGYSSPVVAELGGTRQFVTQSQNRLVGVSAADGAPAVAGAAPHQLRPELGDAARREWPGRLVGPRDADHRLSGVARGRLAGRLRRSGGTSRCPVHELAGGDRQAIIGLSHRNRGQFVALDLATGKTLWTHARTRRRQRVHHPGRRVAAARRPPTAS